MLTFQCSTCGQMHDGVPSFGWNYPLHYLEVPEAERERRCVLTSDTCVIDDRFFFVRGCLEIPVAGEDEPLSWGVWTSLSEKNFLLFQDLYHETHRSGHGPFFGWLSSHIGMYPDTMNLKTMVHLRNHGIRPFVELEPTDHPLAVEQRNGIPLERVAKIMEQMLHPT